MWRVISAGVASIALLVLLAATPSTAAAPPCGPVKAQVKLLKTQVSSLKKQVAALTAENAKLKSNRVRWDLVEFAGGTVLPGGTNVAKAATGDTISLAGSGEARPSAGDAAGGGRFVQRNSVGAEVARGIWNVTGFVKWTPAGGSFEGSADGIGRSSEASAGLLVLNIRLVPDVGAPIAGTLAVHCNFGVDSSITGEEGVSLTLGAVNFEQNGGSTLFYKSGT